MERSPLKKIRLWLLSLILAIALGYFQRITGPTYPKKVKIVLEGHTISGNLPRSGITGEETPVVLHATPLSPDQHYSLFYRKYRFEEQWHERQFSQENDHIIAYLPSEPPAGKLEYAIGVPGKNGEMQFLLPETIVIRYKGFVPPAILASHVLFIFAFFILSCYTFLHTLIFRTVPYRSLRITLLLLIIGGLLLGPVVQKYAFGAYWTGIPFGYDLTDNKVLFSFILWIIALIRNRKGMDKKWIYLAAIGTFIIFLIPHSMLGSTLDYRTMEIIQR